MSYSEVPELKKEDDIALQRLILMAAVIGGCAGDKDVVDLILARPAQHLRITGHAAGAVVAGTLMADGDNVGAQPGQLQPHAAVIGITDDGDAVFADAKAGDPVPGNVHGQPLLWETLSGSDRPKDKDRVTKTEHMFRVDCTPGSAVQQDGRSPEGSCAASPGPVAPARAR